MSSRASHHHQQRTQPEECHDHRKMLTLEAPQTIQIVTQVQPGQTTYGCLACCHAPDCLWCLSSLPFFKLPERVHEKMEDSKYIYVRENSVEWNDPEVVCASSKCCIPVNPCQLDVADRVHVVYYDNRLMDKIENKTRCCNDSRTWCCGGKGQRVRLADQFCAGCCFTGKILPCIPTCCPEGLCGACTNTYSIYCEDADTARYEIKQARANAKARMGMS